MLAWEPAHGARIGAARRAEMRSLARMKYLDAVCVFLWAATPVLVSLATFAMVVQLLHGGGGGGGGGGGSGGRAPFFRAPSRLGCATFARVGARSRRRRRERAVTSPTNNAHTAMHKTGVSGAGRLLCMGNKNVGQLGIHWVTWHR
jgi:hypothetical protein